MPRTFVVPFVLAGTLFATSVSEPARAARSVYPTGTTIYDPDRAWSGYVEFNTSGEQGAVLVATSVLAQRLPNGNTAITEGADGRLLEVTPDNEIVWEYLVPYFNPGGDGRNNIYRAYRVPYDWIPQLDQPQERRVVLPDLSEFRIARNSRTARLYPPHRGFQP